MRREKTTSTRPRGEPITPCRPKEPAPAVQHTGQNKRPQRFQRKNPILKKRRGRKGEKPAATMGRRGEESAVLSGFNNPNQPKSVFSSHPKIQKSATVPITSNLAIEH